MSRIHYDTERQCGISNLIIFRVQELFFHTHFCIHTCLNTLHTITQDKLDERENGDIMYSEMLCQNMSAIEWQGGCTHASNICANSLLIPTWGLTGDL